MEIPDCVPADMCRDLLRDMKSLSECPDAVFTRVHPVTLTALSREVSERIDRRVSDTWFLTTYGPGEMSDLHADGRVRFPDGSMSDVSVLLYLNDDFEGGRTRFYGPDLEVTPVAGSILLIDPDVLHQGLAVESGINYVLRGDATWRASVSTEQNCKST
jgi:2OG-Fe(II) oxygenase superfamily